MGIFDSYDYDESKQADDLRLRILNFIGKKGDRAVEKGIITAEENKKLYSAVKKSVNKMEDDWWLDEKGSKSYEIAMDLLKEVEYMTYYQEVEILEKIEKA